MSPGEIAGASIQVLLALAAGWVIGDFLLRRFWGRVFVEQGAAHGDLEDVGLPERALFSLVGFVALSVVLMLLHIATGGLTFRVAWFVPVIVVAVVVWGLSHRTHLRGRVRWPTSAIFAVVLIGLYVVPGILGGSSIRSGDDQWHLGWTQQLLAGNRVPVGPAPVDANAYPWGFHAMMATLVRMVPATTPAISLEALQILIVLSIPLAAACLARSVDARAGLPAALSVSLIGGFGWVISGGPAFLTSPGNQYIADLTTSSPNALYELLPPPLPRELGLALLVAVAISAIWAIARGTRTSAIGCGLVLGLVGLISVPMLLCGAVWMVAVAMMWAPAKKRLAFLGWCLGTGVMVFALWAAPVAVNYFRHGGFVNITFHLGKEWALITALGSWGLMLPLAMFGFYLALRSARGRPLVAFTSASLLLLALALLRDQFGWNLGGNATALHQGRVWPPLHLLGAALAGVVVSRLWATTQGKRHRAVVVSTCLIFAVGSISPVLASIRLSEIIAAHSSGFPFGAPGFDPGAFVARAASHLSPDDVVAVRGAGADNAAGLLAFTLFDDSGVRLARYDNPKLPDNDLRIRYRDLAVQWAGHRSTGAYKPDFLVIPCRAPCRGALVSGSFAATRWGLFRRSG